MSNNITVPEEVEAHIKKVADELFANSAFDFHNRIPEKRRAYINGRRDQYNEDQSELARLREENEQLKERVVQAARAAWERSDEIHRSISPVTDSEDAFLYEQMDNHLESLKK